MVPEPSFGGLKRLGAPLLVPEPGRLTLPDIRLATGLGERTSGDCLAACILAAPPFVELDRIMAFLHGFGIPRGGPAGFSPFLGFSFLLGVLFGGFAAQSAEFPALVNFKLMLGLVAVSFDDVNAAGPFIGEASVPRIEAAFLTPVINFVALVAENFSGADKMSNNTLMEGERLFSFLEVQPKGGHMVSFSVELPMNSGKLVLGAFKM